MARKKQDETRPEKVDGIEQFNNPLPTWWVALFNFTLIFGLGYITWFHVLGKPGIKEELVQDRKSQDQLVAAQQQVSLSPEEIAARLKDPKLVEEGKGLYATHCSPC